MSPVQNQPSGVNDSAVALGLLRYEMVQHTLRIRISPSSPTLTAGGSGGIDRFTDRQ